VRPTYRFVGSTRGRRSGPGDRTRKRARQRGNAILEGALIFLPMMAFFFGIVDVSLGIFIQSTLTTATREGTRFAITYGSTFNGNSCASSQSSCVDQVVQYNAVGLPAGLAASYITVNYYTANDLANPVMACNNGNLFHGCLHGLPPANCRRRLPTARLSVPRISPATSWKSWLPDIPGTGWCRCPDFRRGRESRWVLDPSTCSVAWPSVPQPLPLPKADDRICKANL
jgi:hypothetical protein